MKNKHVDAWTVVSRTNGRSINIARYSGKGELHNEAQPLLQADESVLQPVQTDPKQRVQGSRVEKKPKQ